MNHGLRFKNEDAMARHLVETSGKPVHLTARAKVGYELGLRGFSVIIIIGTFEVVISPGVRKDLLRLNGISTIVLKDKSGFSWSVKADNKRFFFNRRDKTVSFDKDFLT